MLAGAVLTLARGWASFFLSLRYRGVCDMKVSVLTLLVFVFSLTFLFASVTSLDNNNDGIADQWFNIEGDVILDVEADQDYDGVIDYRAIYNGNKEIAYEEFDFNHDGRMDDFYFYDEEGLLVRQEIDSNFDDEIDIWVYLYQGMYIKSYERDTNFDGEIDLVKNFGQE